MVILNDMGDAEGMETIFVFGRKAIGFQIFDEVNPSERGKTRVTANATETVVERIKRTNRFDFVTIVVPKFDG